MVEILGEKYLSEKEAASMIGYSRQWLQKERKSGNGPRFVRSSKYGKVLYPKNNLELWIKSKMQEYI